jgi:flagellar motor protein MotB
MPRGLRAARVAIAATLIGVLGLTLGGCNSSNTALGEANRALTDRVTALTQENESLKNLVQQLQSAMTARDKAISDLQLALNAARDQNAQFASQLGEIDERFKNMKFGSLLDPSTDSALAELARQHSDLLEYDAARGLIRFKSDVTFDSGSDKVREGAKSTLAQLAGILNSAAAGYDIRVVGHTDSQRLNPATAQKHTTNLRLSADRAISVRNRRPWRV